MSDTTQQTLSDLTSFEKRIFMLLFLMMETDVRTVRQVVLALVKKEGGEAVAVTESAIEAVLSRLKQRGLATQVRAVYSCAVLPLPEQRELFKLPDVKAYMDMIERVINASSYDSYQYEQGCLDFYFGNRLKPYCFVHEALLNNRLGEAEDLLRVKRNRLCDLDWQAYCDRLLPTVMAAPDAVSQHMFFYLFPNIAESALASCAPAADFTRIVTEHLTKLNTFALSPSMFLNLCAWYAWTASCPGLALLADKAEDDVQRTAVMACQTLLLGDFAAAEKLFAKVLKGFTDYKVGGDVDECGNFFCLAALTAIRVNASQTRVRMLLSRLGASYHTGSYCTRQQISLGNLDEVANKGALAVTHYHRERKTTLDLFVRSLETLFLEDKAVEAKTRAESLPLLVNAHRSGYSFMVASLIPCVLRLRPDDDAARETCQRVAAITPAVPLWGESHITQAWEQALKEIGDLLPCNPLVNQATDRATLRTHQFKWVVVFDPRKTDDVKVRNLIVRLQKRLKSGKWSAGQTLSPEKLRSGEVDAWLDEQDRIVKDAVVNHLANRYSYSFYDSDAAYRVLPALIGHPRVFTVAGDGYGYIEDRALIPVRIERGEPFVEFSSVNKNQQAELLLHWRADSHYKELQIVCAHSGVYTVYEKNALHQRLAEIVHKYGSQNRLKIPAEGGETLKRLLVPLAQVVGVKGEFDTEAVDARTVEGGVNLHLRARFVNEVLHLDLVNQPAPELPLFVAPGSGTRKALTRHASETVAIVRDLDAERQAFAEFEKACPSLESWAETETHWEIGSLPDILTALNEAHDLAALVSLDWPEGNALTVQRTEAGTPFVFNSVAGTDFWLEIGGDVALDDGKVFAFSELIARVGDRTGNFVRLSERKFLYLKKTLVHQLEQLAKAGELSKKALRLPPAALPLLDSLATGKEALDFPSLVRDRVADFRKAFKSNHPTPASLTCELRPYQKEGFVWLAKLDACGLGACLADDMGLGKTIQLLALLTARADKGPSLVIAPTSVTRNWADEATRFAPALRVSLLAESADRAELISQAVPYDVVVCSYGLLTFLEDVLVSRTWNVVVLDEAQAVKNRLAKRARIVKRLTGRMRAAATGTPVENNLSDLWSLFDFLNPGLLGSHSQFEKRYCNSDGSVSSLLKKMTAPFILRRLKSEVLEDLPPKTEITLTVTLDDDERSLYESCRRKALASIENREDEANRIMILAHLTKLRRACCHPSLLLPGCPMPGQKVEAFLELVANLRASGHRTLVFSQFVDFLSIIRQRLDQEGLSYQYLDGATPLNQRAEAVARFQRGEGDLFLISLKAGGTGLNLTAANYVILLDPWWNPAVEIQAADRAHRIGQRNPVTIYRLVTADTVEERVVELHAKKRALAEALLDDTDSTQLTVTDLMALFKT